MEKILKLMIIGVLSLNLLTGCTNNDNTPELKDDVKEEAKGNCSVTECIKQIETTNTVEEINEIIGFEGEKSDYSETYTWKLDSKNSILLDNTSTSPILQVTIDKNSIKSEEVDFGVYSELKELLDSGKSFTYEEVVAKLNNVEGTLAGKTSSSKSYMWVDKHERTLRVTISDKTGKCSIMSLR